MIENGESTSVAKPSTESDQAQPAVRQGYEVGRGKNGTIGKKRKESLKNPGGGLCRELLPRNRLDEGSERIRALIPGETARTVLFDDGAQDGIALCEQACRLGGVVGGHDGKGRR